MILIIGGSSKIGRELVRLLRERGEHVRVLIRKREASESLERDGVETVVGDLAQPATIASALQDVDRLFLLSGPHHDAVAWHTHAIDAAARAGVKLLVRSSILGADSESTSTFLRQHGVCDQRLHTSGVPFVVVRPNYFLQNVTETNLPSIGADGVFAVPAGDARLSMVDTRDVAAVAAVVLCEAGHAGHVYSVTGPEALSHDDIARQMSAVLGRPVTYVNQQLESFRAGLEAFGVQAWMAGALAELYAEYQRSGPNGYAAQVTNTVQELTGRPARTLEELLEESAIAAHRNVHQSRQ